MPIIDIENSNLSQESKEILISEIKQHPDKESEIIESFKQKLEQNTLDFYKHIGLND
jgi:hypothetical protein